MTNYMIFMAFTYVVAVVLSFAMDGTTGIAATELTSALTPTSTSLPVHSTSNFLASDFVILGEETICYGSKTSTAFGGLTRGCQGTVAASHSAGARVYSEPAGLVNQMIGFNVIQTLSENNVLFGIFKAAWQLPGVVKNVFTKFVLWDFAYLESPGGVYFKYMFLYPLSFGMVISLFILAWRR